MPTMIVSAQNGRRTGLNKRTVGGIIFLFDLLQSIVLVTKESFRRYKKEIDLEKRAGE